MFKEKIELKVKLVGETDSWEQLPVFDTFECPVETANWELADYLSYFSEVGAVVKEFRWNIVGIGQGHYVKPGPDGHGGQPMVQVVQTETSFYLATGLCVDGKVNCVGIDGRPYTMPTSDGWARVNTFDFIPGVVFQLGGPIASTAW